ncbi:hypothetical protein L7F22_064056 [Adiantum nelumboides]|nr:hypothetical protein [Adiantum nelumboides]
MISVKNRLPIATLDQVRQSLGFPVDYKESLVKKYPDVFRLKERKGFLYLELKEWDESLAITVFEKNTQEGKYIKKPKKKRTDRVTIEEIEQESLCEVDPKESFPSVEEEEVAL